MATAAFRKDGRDFARGSLLVFGAEEAPDEEPLRAELERVAAAGATVVGVEGPLSESGPHLGSDRFVPVASGPTAMVRDGPVRPSAYGAARFLFERRYRLPFTALSREQLAETDLRRYRVLVLPDSVYPGPASDSDCRTGPGAPARMDRRRRRGGGDAGASAWLAGGAVSWTKTRLRGRFTSKSAFMTEGGRPDGEPEPEATGEEAPAEIVPGAILRATPNPESFLSFRLRGTLPGAGLVEPGLRDRPRGRCRGARFAGDLDALLGSGFAFPDSLADWPGRPMRSPSASAAGGWRCSRTTRTSASSGTA